MTKTGPEGTGSRSRRAALRARLDELGPGVITGAADDDPSGIATYTQAGAGFGFGLLWSTVFTYPLMAAIQMVSARIGCITGRGLAANIKAALPRPVLYAVVGLLLLANCINIAANISAMGAALELVLGGSAHVYSVTFGLLCLVLQVFLRYQTYVRYLKWLTLALLAYVAVVFLLDIDWTQVLRGLALPHFALDHDTIVVVVAVLGTTISPYLFFWQAAQEKEDAVLAAARDGRAPGAPPEALARAQLRRIRRDTWIGMGFSNVIAFCIMLSAAATLHPAGITTIDSAAQAAEALRPLAGEATFLLFALGIIGTGMLAVPVLAGSAAYALAETLDWRSGLDMKLDQARRFYAIIAFATLGGVLLDFTPLNPMRALLWSAVLNGIIAVPIMAVMMLVASDPRIMGTYVIRRRLARLGWAATAVMAVTVVAMFATL